MLFSRWGKPLCSSCRHQLASLFLEGFGNRPQLSTSTKRPRYGATVLQARSFRTTPAARDAEEAQAFMPDIEQRLQASATEMEAMAQQARQTYGENLPVDFLTPAEYGIYKRLYGEPLHRFEPTDTDPPPETTEDERASTRGALLRENDEGDLEEIEHEVQSALEAEDVFDDGEVLPIEDQSMLFMCHSQSSSKLTLRQAT